jgi:hypothetical protein
MPHQAYTRINPVLLIQNQNEFVQIIKNLVFCHIQEKKIVKRLLIQIVATESIRIILTKAILGASECITTFS